MRRTLKDAKDSRIAEALCICPTDPAFIQYVNEAQEMLLHRGRFWGTVGRWNICVSDGCITLPATLDTIERAAVCHSPVRVRDMWYEFLDNGWGTESQGPGCASCGGAFGCGCSGGAKYRGNFPSFSDIAGTNKKLNLICDLSEDVGKEVLVLGYDQNNNWIRTDQDGVIKDGELVALAQSPGTLTTKFFSSLTDLQPPDDLDGQWWLYEYNTDDTTQRMIGQYQYWETRPSYKRYLFSGICNPTSNGDGDCNKTLVEVLAKLAFVPVKVDTDYLVIGNLKALKEACLAVKFGEPPSDIQRSEACLARAIRELDLELGHQLGAGRQIGINVSGGNIGYAVPVPAFM